MVEGSIDPKVVEDAVNKVCNCLVEIDAYRDAIKTIVGDANAKTGVEKADILKIAKMRNKNSVEDEKAKANEIFDLYEAVFGDE